MSKQYWQMSAWHFNFKAEVLNAVSEHFFKMETIKILLLRKGITKISLYHFLFCFYKLMQSAIILYWTFTCLKMCTRHCERFRYQYVTYLVHAKSVIVLKGVFQRILSEIQPLDGWNTILFAPCFFL